MDQGAFWRSGETADSNGVTFRDTPLVFKGPKTPPPVYQPRTWRVWTGGFRRRTIVQRGRRHRQR
jgi:hypothetical protein